MVPGSRFTVEGKADSRFLTVNHEPKTLIRYAVYDFGSIKNPAELLPEIEPCPKHVLRQGFVILLERTLAADIHNVAFLLVRQARFHTNNLKGIHE